ncbi:Transcriptional regulatory protein DcuR [Corynebacterium occultum]|uniref:Transcriptional regulatory protein n=1 Tax=Corynebacterium occultum TaxID=2675219 RepID=A0A6B8W0X9_9CORY|nr:response regulator [Corynebacterium occultum]QGU06141.1 Transcriptional regulatory protein DcuR [Corynebacterium occultum]
MEKTWSVLVVDDDFRVAGIHAEIVEAAPGFRVQDSVRSIAEAHQVLAGTQPDLMLVDVYLPDGDGIELVRSTGIDAFILSAADEAATVRRALHAGALGYLLKPFQRQVLTERLDRYARYRHVLSGQRGLRQEKIDQALSILHGPPPGTAVSRSTTEQLLLDALGRGELSAAEAAEAAGVSRATAQRRLATMASQGVVQVRLRYGTSGRPEHLYSKLR